MSPNHNPSCTNTASIMEKKCPKKEMSRGGKTSRRRKLRRGFVVLVVFFVLIWVLTCLSNGTFGRKVKPLVRIVDQTNDSSQNCNVLTEKIASSETRTSTVACALKILGSKNSMFDRQQGLVAEYSPLPGHCLIAEEVSMSTIVGSTLSFISAACHYYKEVIEPKAFEFTTAIAAFLQKELINVRITNRCDEIYFILASICLCIIIGVIVSYNYHKLYDQSRSPENEMAQQQSLLLRDPQVHPSTQQYHSRSTGKWMKKLLFMFVLGGIVFSGWLFWHLNEDIVFRRKETLTSMCDERARMLQDQFNVSMNHVHALAILISTFHHGKRPSAMDQKTFEEYTERTAFERPLTSGVAYALRVRHTEREQFEKQYGWSIKKMNDEDQTLAQDYNPENFHTSPVQDEYAPVIFSQKTVSHIVSIDMMSGKVRFRKFLFISLRYLLYTSNKYRKENFKKDLV